ncbi:MAG: hypothetical protein QM518_02095 [Verrucomicrobiota bacterium]|jgi:hypothetical protein|nr:hypothetical protein [Verrucomicrobiota bacterium]
MRNRVVLLTRLGGDVGAVHEGQVPYRTGIDPDSDTDPDPD